MVDVGGKAITRRTATAQSIVLLPAHVAKLFLDEKKDFNTPKGHQAGHGPERRCALEVRSRVLMVAVVTFSSRVQVRCW
jgi:hypothetical protein